METDTDKEEYSYNVGVIGATGMVGQRFLTLLEHHPWFHVTVLAASSRSAGKTYGEAIKMWLLDDPMPGKFRDMPVYDAVKDMEKIVSMCDFCFCAVNMGKEETKALEESYAKMECPIISNNSANRETPDVPMIIPEINPEHLEVIKIQKRRLHTKRGFIAVKSNCSIQSYVPLLHPLMKYGIETVAVSTYQAISGAGKTFKTMPEINDNVIPFIPGEEKKSETEPLKIWGYVSDSGIVSATKPEIVAQCVRVPVSDGHTATIDVKFTAVPFADSILEAWENYRGEPQTLNLPSAPRQFIHYMGDYMDEKYIDRQLNMDRPQPALDKMTENGMAICAGKLIKIKHVGLFDYKFVGMSHNTIRGAAGGAVLLAELIAKKGYFD